MTDALRRSTFSVPRMDCPSEERMIRLALEGAEDLASLAFDLPARRLEVVHGGEPGPILARLEPLGLGAALIGSAEAPGAGPARAAPAAEARERATLRLVLALNAAMFAVEGVAGWLAESTGLLADGLDMAADAGVYALALHAAGRAAAGKVRAARFAGGLQAALAVLVLGDVLRRAVAGSDPEPPAMMAVALAALLVNLAALALLARHRDGGVHMRASWIFTSTDVLANLGVIAAGALVGVTGSRVPDLAVGALVGLLVLGGAVRILRLRPA